MIPLGVPLTTTIEVLRVVADPLRDPYDAAPAASVIASGIRAQISTSTGRERTVGGSQEVVEFRLTCDPVDLTNTDQVRDENTDEVYEVLWARLRPGIAPGQKHVEGALRQVSGVAG